MFRSDSGEKGRADDPHLTGAMCICVAYRLHNRNLNCIDYTLDNHVPPNQ